MKTLKEELQQIVWTCISKPKNHADDCSCNVCQIIDQLLSLFKDTMEKVIPETIYLNQYKDKEIRRRNQMLVNGYNKALREFRQNLEKEMRGKK